MWKACFNSRNTTRIALLALLAVVTCSADSAYALLDNDVETLPNWDRLGTAVVALIVALAAFFARDADRSSQDAGIK